MPPRLDIGVQRRQEPCQQRRVRAAQHAGFHRAQRIATQLSQQPRIHVAHRCRRTTAADASSFRTAVRLDRGMRPSCMLIRAVVIGPGCGGTGQLPRTIQEAAQARIQPLCSA